jgi:predicted TIM-barrel fold metal-dependent hydrolase
MVLADTGLRIIDADTHLTEPTDLWTARLPERFRDEAPQVRFHEPTGTWRWQIGDRWCTMVGNYSVAGWRELYPSCPPTLEEADPACYDAKARLALMDSEGIYAQVLYPNVIAFEGHAFIALKDDALKLACVQTYNDYQSEFASEAPDRFILLSMLPFWDLDASLVELQRCHALGHKGILWASTLEKHGLPEFMDPHWDRLYAMAQDLGMSINFHVGVGNTSEEIELATNRTDYDPAFHAARSSIGHISHSRTIGFLLTSGLCERFPRLDFVSVESGFGYIPFLLDSLDWQWNNLGARDLYPNRLMPSEYFMRQVYSMFWHEHSSLELLPKYQDNVMFESDFPHPTSLSPGPASYAPSPSEVIRRDTAIVGEEVMRKVLQDNAFRVYHLD